VGLLLPLGPIRPNVQNFTSRNTVSLVARDVNVFVFEYIGQVALAALGSGRNSILKSYNETALSAITATKSSAR
jgi:hypothetical protein